MQHIKNCDELLLEKRILSKKEIIRELKTRYVKFVYYKKTGVKRTAYGTLKPKFIAKHYTFKGGNPGVEAAKAMGYIVYFDLKRNMFRMFHLSRKVYLAKTYKTVKEIIDERPNLYKYIKKYVPHKLPPRLKKNRK